MLKGNVHRKASEGIRTTLGKETKFKGTMRFEDSLKIEGKFEGEIVSRGFLYIEKGAEVRANITVGSLVIGGTVQGNIIAYNKVEMLSTGQVYGNVKTRVLKIADGVVFDGKCEMIKDTENFDIFSASVENLKQVAKSI